MPEPDDITLLKQYAEGDESAFTALFDRYVHLVYSTAIRQVRNPSHAEEITQAVFILLARKAKSLSPKTVLSGWLYQAARLTTASLIKREVRRERREQELYMQTLIEPDTSLWEQISPLLDEAMGRLGEQDRNAIVLRFFENRTPLEVATALKLNEVTARKRVSRALEKLRKLFANHGVVSTTVVIAGAISGNSVQAAPMALASSSAAAIAKGAMAGNSTLTLAHGALKLMAWTKASTAIAVGTVILLAAGAATFTVKETRGANEHTFSLTNDQNIVITYRTKDPQLEEYMKRVNAIWRIKNSSDPDRMEKFLNATRDLIKDYPARPNGYQNFMAVMMEDYEFFGKPDDARALANELLNSRAPDHFKQWTHGFLDRMDDLGKPITLQFTAMDGREVDLKKLNGKVVLVDFWEGEESPQIRSLFEKYHSQNFEVLGIYCYTDKSECEEYIQTHHVTWPQYFDGQQMNKIRIQFGIDGIPHMFLVDKVGRLRFDNLRTGKDLDKKVAELLAE